MRTENDEIRDNLKYLTLLSRDYPSQAAAASEIIRFCAGNASDTAVSDASLTQETNTLSTML